MYLLLVYLHVISAMLSIGPFFVYFPYLRNLTQLPQQELEWFIRSFRFAVRLSKHAGHVLVATGALLVWLGGWPWSTSWIVLTLVVMFSSLYFFARAFTPILQALAEAEPVDRDRIVRRFVRAFFGYLALLLLMMSFMVMKPTIW